MEKYRSQTKSLAAKYKSSVIEWRRHLHMHPELSFEEHQTTKYIIDLLERWGIDYNRLGMKTGVMAVLSNGQGPVIALRGDMDALPIEEAGDKPYKSQNEGVMHACGHDVHTSSLLGTLKILKEMEGEWKGTVKFLFQPAEERFPGGATAMIRAGVLKDPRVEQVYGQHVHPPLEAGKIGMRAGAYMASADEIDIHVRGRGGHGAIPSDTVDPVAIAASIIQNLQQLVSRKTDPVETCVMSIGSIQSVGGTFNVIPDEVKMKGTFRAHDEKWRSEGHEWVRRITTLTAEALGGSAEVNITRGYPSLHNDKQQTEFTFQCGVEYLGEENVVELRPRMTGEDFAYFALERPACFYRLGTGNPEKGIISPIHTNSFDVDEDCLEVGSGFMAYLALRALSV